MFGGTKPTFGTPASSSVFGQNTNTLFGGSGQKPATTSLFGQSSVGALGAATQQSTSLFGGTGTIAWGSGGSGTNVTATTGGTTLQFNPPIAQDTVQRSGQPTQVNAKHMCITSMKEYLDKSLEELRVEDYALNRQKGSSSILATSSVAPSLFGASSTATKPFSFGAVQTTTTSSLFGQTSKPNTLFGGTGFGAAATAGTTVQSTFGQPAQTQAGGILGLKPPQFGVQPQTTNLFGTATSTPQASGAAWSFGQTNTAAPAFGAKPLYGGTTSTGLFGTQQQQQAPTASTGFAFGQTQPQQQTTTNLFGQPTATAAKPLFGAQPTLGATSAFGATSNLFGAPKTTTTTAPLFGAPATGLTGIQPQQQQTAFGFSGIKPASGTGLFGTQTATNVSKPGGIFGTATTQATSNAFGFGTTAQNPAFGLTAPAGGLFGQPAATGLGNKKPFGFGSTFGGTTASSAPNAFGFGQQQQQAQIGGGLFGTSTASASQPTAFGLGVGTNMTGGGLFGQSTSMFGQKPALSAPMGTGFGLGSLGGTGLGAGTAGALGLSSTGFGTFGATTGTLGSGVGNLGLGQNFFGLSGIAGLTNEQLAQNVRAQQQVLDLVRSMPYGQSPLFRFINMTPDAEASTTPVETHKKSLVPHTSANLVLPAKAVASSLAERHRAAGLSLGAGSPGSPSSRTVGLRRPGVTQRLLQISNRSKLFSGFHEDDLILSPAGHTIGPSSHLRRSSTTCWDILPLSEKSSEFLGKSGFFVHRDEWKRLHLPDNVRTSILERSAASLQVMSDLAEASFAESRSQTGKEVDESLTSAAGAGDGESVFTDRKASPFPTSCTTPLRPNTTVTVNRGIMSPAYTSTRGPSRSHDAPSDAIVFEDLENTWNSPAAPNIRSAVLSPSPKPVENAQTPLCGIKLSKPGYYTLPTLDDLNDLMGRDGHCLIEDFVVGRRHYGRIVFPGITDVAGLDLDSIVHIRRREVVVYLDDGKKPPVGEGLNKRAEVCLESIWPTDKATREPIKSPDRLALMRFEERLERATRRMDARFIEYRPEAGCWVFEVKHFSKYRLEDSDDEEDSSVASPPSYNSTAECTTSTLHVTTTPFPPMDYHKSQPHKPPQLKAISELILQTDSQMDTGSTEHFKPPSEFTGQRFNSMANESSCMVVDEPPSMMRTTFEPNHHLRRAIFSPSVKKVPSVRREGSMFSRRLLAEPTEDDEEDLYEGHEITGDSSMELNNLSFMGGKRLTDDLLQVGKSDDWDSTMVDSFTTGKNCLGPTSEKLARFFDPSEKNSKHIDELKVMKPPSTPFRPIPAQAYAQGTLLSAKCAHLTGSDFAQLPTGLRHTGGYFSNESSNFSADLFPYEEIYRIFPDKNIKRSSASKHLSNLLLDAGLCRGHGMRIGYGLLRTHDLHTMAVVLPCSSTNQSVDSMNNQSPFAYPLSINCLPIRLGQVDELLLNAALLSSERVLPGIDSNSNPTNLCPPSVHCPFWRPISGLQTLESCAHALEYEFPNLFSTVLQYNSQFEPRILAIRRLVGLCLALWGRHPQERLENALIKNQSVVHAGANRQEHEMDMSDDGCRSVGMDFMPAESIDPVVDEVGGSSASQPTALRKLVRKQAVSEWIRAESYPWLNKRLKSLALDAFLEPHKDGHTIGLEKNSIDNIGEGIFACLLCGEPGAACRIAISSCMPNLASLIAEASAGSIIVRRGLQLQINVWHELHYDRHFPPIILRTYALLAGQLRYPHPTKASLDISVLANVDWIRAFGAHLWYLTSYESELVDVVEAFSRNWHSAADPQSQLTMSPPIPPLLAELCDPTELPDLSVPLRSSDTAAFRNWPRDSAYHLLHLYFKPTHNLERTLDPCSISRHSLESVCQTDPLSLEDWSASWILWHILHSLGYQQFRNAHSSSRLTTEFAAQLEVGGLWEWAIFVQLHQPDQTIRDANVKALIARHAALVLPPIRRGQSNVDLDEQLDLLAQSSKPPPLTKAEQFVINLGVPICWIHEAKAVLAHAKFASCSIPPQSPYALGPTPQRSGHASHMRIRTRLLALLEVIHWFAAGHVRAAHDICFAYLLPDLVLHTNLSSTTPGLTTSSSPMIFRLGHRLNNMLKFFRLLPDTRLPGNFATGAGVYLMYGDIIKSSEELAKLCQPSLSALDEISESPSDDESDAQEKIASILSDLQFGLRTFLERLQVMDMPNLITRVVKTEMAATCTELISAFPCTATSPTVVGVMDIDTRSAIVNRLQNQLSALTKVKLPVEYVLKELTEISQTDIGMGLV